MIKLVHIYVAVAILMLSHCKSTTLPNLGANDDQGISTSDLEGVTSARAKGRDRIQYQFDLIHRTYASVTHFNEMPQKMLEIDLRATFMRIQSIIRLYRDYFKNDHDSANRLEIIAKQAKSLEDNLGTLADIVKLPSILEQTQASPDFIEFAKVKANRSVPQFITYLKQTGWGPELTTLKDMEKNLSKIIWPSHPDKDRDVVFSQIADEARDIVGRKYPLNDLDKGIHQLRKDLRWILLEIQSTNGLIIRDDSSCPINSYQSLVTSPVATSKYGVLPESPQESSSCKLAGCVYLAVVTHNGNIAEVKDLGLWQEQIEALIKEFKPSTTTATAAEMAAKMIKKYPNYRDPSQFSKNEFALMKRTSVLEELAKELKSCK